MTRKNIHFDKPMLDFYSLLRMVVQNELGLQNNVLKEKKLLFGWKEGNKRNRNCLNTGHRQKCPKNFPSYTMHSRMHHLLSLLLLLLLVAMTKFFRVLFLLSTPPSPLHISFL